MAKRRRKYQLHRRAETQAETRLRIVEAAVALHQTLGPARTTISAVAERADVGRPTVYRHYPDERSLFQACSGHYMAQHPPPDPAAWRGIAEPGARLRAALAVTYAWYRETEEMFTAVFRDLPNMPIVGEVMAPQVIRQNAMVSELCSALAPAPGPALRAAINHAVSFPAWRSLAIDQELADADIVDLMSGMIGAALKVRR